MIFETTINLKNKSKEELLDLLNDSLKIIQSQQEEIELSNKVIDKRNQEKLELAKELLKKDKIIDLMAEMLVKVPNNSDSPQTAAIVAMLNRDLELKKLEVKKYFEMKVENENDNWFFYRKRS